jgi:predicted glycoside hydrolase/deacetylase ChbG (UPF0249 family)
LGVSRDVQTIDRLNCAKRQLSLPAELGGLNVSSLELDAEFAQHYASFIATLANLITYYESESLGPMYGLIRQELMQVAIEIEIEIVYNNTSINRLLSVAPPCTMPNWTYKQE